MGLPYFILERRIRISCSDGFVQIREGFRTCIADRQGDDMLYQYVADRLPLFYRTAEAIADDLRSGQRFLTPFRDTLRRLPTSKGHQKSHFGEVLASIFAEEVLGYRLLYSKLSLLTAENTNPYKMDVLLVDMDTDPLVFYLLEAKCSTQVPHHGQRVYHKHGIYKGLIRSLREYEGKDRSFDLSAARDRLSNFSEAEAKRIKEALIPPPTPTVKTLGVAAIDILSEHVDDTDYVLSEPCCTGQLRCLSEPCGHRFSVDILCLEKLEDAIEATFEYLERFQG